ncbi:effector-associated constant component EACC1, partial [Actinomadura logoneensis]|uniref:effector-associated constant component EACC1 n=1 Tax=Actinomadura logoneensis TaxID=2293572 RepID=UPI0038B2324F
MLTMDARIKISAADPVRETAGLYEFLRGDRTLAGRVRAEAPPPRDGELGGATDVLVVA